MQKINEQRSSSRYGEQRFVSFQDDRLVGLVVKASASRAEDPGF